MQIARSFKTVLYNYFALLGTVFGPIKENQERLTLVVFL
jgi:hypothetical protein